MAVRRVVQHMISRSSQAKTASATITEAQAVAGYNQQLVEAQTGCACLVPQTPGATEVGIPGQSGGVGHPEMLVSVAVMDSVESSTANGLQASARGPLRVVGALGNRVVRAAAAVAAVLDRVSNMAEAL